MGQFFAFALRTVPRRVYGRELADSHYVLADLDADIHAGLHNWRWLGITAKTSLIVEDNQLNMKLFNYILQSHGYQTVRLLTCRYKGPYKRLSPKRCLSVLHIAPILPTHLEQRIRDLAQGADPHRIHQHGEHIIAITGRLPKPLQHGGSLLGMTFMESGQTLQL